MGAALCVYQRLARAFREFIDSRATASFARRTAVLPYRVYSPSWLTVAPCHVYGVASWNPMMFRAKEKFGYTPWNEREIFFRPPQHAACLFAGILYVVYGGRRLRCAFTIHGGVELSSMGRTTCVRWIVVGVERLRLRKKQGRAGERRVKLRTTNETLCPRVGNRLGWSEL